MKLDRDELWFWLTGVERIGSVKIASMLETFGSIEEIYKATEESLHNVEKLKEKDITNIIKSRDESKIRREFENVGKKDVQFVSIEDEGYPNRLKNLFDPPYGIFVKGRLPKENLVSIAIVGARECSSYGKEIAVLFARELARAGVQVISGLARGIDSYAHAGCLEGQGDTFAVLGCGVARCYPSENYPIYQEIVKTGGVISELGLNQAPIAKNFPRRNRLISGLSDGILVIEARQKSGSLITVDQGLEQGKDIFAVPGRVYDTVSAGCNLLLKNGAELVLTPEDILNYYHIKGQYDNLNELTIRTELEADEKIVYEVLDLEPKHINDIILDTCFTVSKVMSILVSLELKGFVKQTIKNYYIVNMN